MRDATSGRAKVLVVGIDGLRWDRVEAGDAPTLRTLARDGLFAPSRLDVTSGAATDSGPGWSAVATGVWADKHGVLDNDFAGADFGRYPDFLSRAKRSDPDLATLAIVDWPPLVEHGVFGPDIDTLVVGDGEEHGYLTEDARLTAVAVRALRESDVDAAFVYLGSVDIAGHGCGAFSPEYDFAVHAVDGWLADLLDAVRQRSTAADERWLVLVTTDHGHRDEGGHGGYSDIERATFIVASGAGLTGVRDDTHLVDVAATVLHHLGVDGPDSLDGRSLLA